MKAHCLLDQLYAIVESAHVVHSNRLKYMSLGIGGPQCEGFFAFSEGLFIPRSTVCIVLSFAKSITFL